MRSQNTHGAEWLRDLLKDLRYCSRRPRRAPGFALTTTIVLALGIGAATAIYAFVDATLVKPLPYREPARLMALFEHNPVGDRFHLSDFDDRRWKDRNHVFTSLELLGDDISEDDHRTSRIHLHRNAVAFTVDLREPGSCRNHEHVLIPQVDSLSKGKAALFEEAKNGNASAMFALSRLFDEGIGEPQDPIEAYFWHSVGMEFCEYDWAGEGFVDAVADQEILAAKLPDLLTNENCSLHKRARDWIRAHRAVLPEGRRENGECFDDDFDEINNEQDEKDEG